MALSFTSDISSLPPPSLFLPQLVQFGSGIYKPHFDALKETDGGHQVNDYHSSGSPNAKMEFRGCGGELI